jgi:predicted Zn-dependent protease
MICARTSAAAAFMLVAGACATAPQAPVADLQPGQRPTLETDEAGLWMRMDAAEEKLSTSGRVVIDPALNAYMRGVMCRLSAEYCEESRVYIVRGPHFNATMAPNGTLKVSTGTLLRVQNEAQLAYVLGHEMGHYIRRHSLQRWRNIRSTTDSMARFTNTTRMVGLGFIGNLADMAAMSGVTAFSREHERESDEIGFDLMVRAGYAGEEVPKVWMALEAEHSAAGLHAPSGFLSSHPATDERLATLQARHCRREQVNTPGEATRATSATWPRSACIAAPGCATRYTNEISREPGSCSAICCKPAIRLARSGS